MLSDAIHSYGDDISEKQLAILADGCLTPAHAVQFAAYVRQVRGQYSLNRILDGTQRWPEKPEERDVLYFLVQSFRARLLKELPANRGKLGEESAALARRAKELLIDLSRISMELAQMAVTPEDGESFPAWFLVEAARDLPGLSRRKA